MNENLYEKIKQTGNKYLELPAQLTLLSAFNDKSRWVKRQIFVPVKLGTVSVMNQSDKNKYFWNPSMRPLSL
jgi:hypothetical protein